MKALPVIAATFLSISVLGLIGCQTVSAPIPEAVVTTPIDPNKLDSDRDGVPDIIDQCPNTLKNRVVDDKGCLVTLYNSADMLEAQMQIYFDLLSSHIPDEYTTDFGLLAEKLKQYPPAHIFIFGHLASNEVDIVLNSRALSKERGLMVKDRLVRSYDITPETITVYDCSDRLPINQTTTSKSDYRAIEFPNSRVTIRASTEINDLKNIKPLTVSADYKDYSQNCNLVSDAKVKK